MILALLTNSRLRTYRECARKHRLMYEDGWRPVRESDAMALGTLVHYGLEAWWRGEDWNAAIAGRARDEYQQAMAYAMLVAYDERWAGDRELYDVLAVEAVAESVMPNPDTWAASRTWMLAGKIDVIVRERATGRVLIVEHKTTGEDVSPGSPYWAKLAMDGQVSHYYVLAEALGYQVSGCIYDVVSRPGIRPLRATPVESRKFTKDGRLYANQREHDETPEQYGERAREAMTAEGTLRRELVSRLESDLRDYLADAWSYGVQIREAKNAGRAPRNPEACHRFGTCPFWDVCANGLDPEDHPDLFARSEVVHPELTGAVPAGGLR